MSLCQYANIFGKPKEGAHKTRVLGLAAVDLIATVVLAIVVTALLKCKMSQVPVVFALLWVLGILLHKLFCVDTPVTKFIFG